MPKSVKMLSEKRAKIWTLNENRWFLALSFVAQATVFFEDHVEYSNARAALESHWLARSILRSCENI